MYKNGVGMKKISAIMSIKESDICHILYQHDIKITDYVYADRDKQICDLYDNGNKIIEIANTLHIDRHTVTSTLKRCGNYKGNRNANNFSDEKSDRNNKIIKYYKSGMSLSQVAKQMNMSPSGIKKVLSDFSVELRPQHMKGHSKGTTKNRKHFFDTNFFEEIDTEEKAYWLGFLYADGYVSHTGTIKIALQEKDISHLKKIKESVKAFDVDIKNSKRTKSCKISLQSVKMANDLFNKGCIQNKSLILTFPGEEIVPKKLLNHFMRGYFDGDGCIYCNGRCATFSILGTKDFVDEYRNILLPLTKKKNKLFHKESWNNTYQLSYSGKDAVCNIYTFLYKDAHIFLDRKKQKFDNFIAVLGQAH